MSRLLDERLLMAAASGACVTAGAGESGAPASKPAGREYAEHPEAWPRSVEAMLTGGAVFVDDIPLADQAHGYVLRSPHPHARIRSINAAAARRAPGVLAVLTGKDVADLAGPLPCVIPPAAYGRMSALPVDRPILAAGRVRHVGDGVAFVVAETLEQAEAASRLIAVDYETLPVHRALHAAATPVPIWQEAPDNVRSTGSSATPIGAGRCLPVPRTPSGFTSRSRACCQTRLSRARPLASPARVMAG